jgi:hypothetical protein
MNKITYLVWFLAILCGALGCKNADQSSEDVLSTQKIPHPPKTVGSNHTQKGHDKTDIDIQAAIETCNCMSPMVEKAKLYKYFEANKQTTDMKRVAAEMVQLQPQIQKCSDEISQRYRNRVEEKQVLLALITQCPDVKILFSYLQKMSNKS